MPRNKKQREKSNHTNGREISASTSIVPANRIKGKESSPWISYKMLSFFMLSLALLTYIFREQLFGSEAEPTDPNTALLLKALSTNGDLTVTTFSSNPTPFLLKVFESCKANLSIPELLAICGMDLCDYAAKIMPPINRLPGAILKIYNDGAIDATPDVEVLEKLDPALYERYVHTYTKITADDSRDLQILSERYQLQARRELSEQKITGETAAFLMDFVITGIYSAMRTCAGSANLLKTLAAIQPGIIAARITLEFFAARNIVDGKKTGIPHAVVVFRSPDNKQSFTGDAWINKFCSREEIENASENMDCAVYKSKHWAAEQNVPLVFPKNLHTYSESQLAFFSKSIKKARNLTQVIHNEILRQATPKRIFHKGMR